MDNSIKLIESINFDAQQFLSSFQRFRNGGRAIDQNLCSSLLSIVSEIDKFLESKPEVLQNPNQIKLTPNGLKKQGVQSFFYCKHCKENLNYSTISVRKHLESSRHLFPRKKAITTTNDSKQKLLVLPRKVKSLLLCDFMQFFKEHMQISNKLKNLREYETIQDELTKLISPAFPGQPIRVYTFGSRISGIGVIHSDLDVFVDIGGVMNVFENRASPETNKKLLKVEEILKANSDKWTNLLCVRAARVPIIKVFHAPTSINCDIGFSNSLGFYNTKLIQYFMDVQPIVTWLSLYLRKWFDRSKLDITSYSVVLMVVYFLQMKKILPSVKALQDKVDQHILVGPWVATFTHKSLLDLQIPQVPNTLEAFRNELVQFFQFYGTFDFESNLICPYLGEQFSLDSLESSQLLPRYVEYVKSEKDTKTAQFKKAFLNIQDPYQLNNNTTKAVTRDMVLTMKQYFLLSCNILTETEVQGETVGSKK